MSLLTWTHTTFSNHTTHPAGLRREKEGKMKYYTIWYAYKSNLKRVFSLNIKAVDEEDARRIAYNKIDNRIYVLI